MTAHALDAILVVGVFVAIFKKQTVRYNKLMSISHTTYPK